MNDAIRPPWFDAAAQPDRPAGERLQTLLAKPGIVGVPGAHDALSARLAQRAGFEALYLSGAALSASMALPATPSSSIHWTVCTTVTYVPTCVQIRS